MQAWRQYEHGGKEREEQLTILMVEKEGMQTRIENKTAMELRKRWSYQFLCYAMLW